MYGNKSEETPCSYCRSNKIKELHSDKNQV